MPSGFRLGAQTRAPMASMTIQVKVPSNTPSGDTITIFQGVLFNSFLPAVQMRRVQGTSDTWQAIVTAPAGTISRYIFMRIGNFGAKESYVPLTPDPKPFRELLIKDGATASETVAQWPDTPLLDNATG